MTAFSQRFSVGSGDWLVAVKDTIDVAGFATQAGSEVLADALLAEQHADVVESVLARGGRLVGKTTLHELAYGMTGVNHWAGTPENPLFPHLIPGGSSSGSAAAVAQGEVDIALGTDTGGSIRVPAACCGVFGLKPTFGRISRQGVMPEHSTLDCVGPFAASAQMLTTAMSLLDPSFSSDSDRLNSQTIHLGVVAVNADAEVKSTVSDFLVSAIAHHDIATQPVQLSLFQSAFTAGMTVINAETWAACGQYLTSGKLGADVAQRLVNAQNTSEVDLAAAEQIRQSFTDQVDEALVGLTALVLPTLPTIPMALSDALAGKTDLNISAFVRPFNLSGHPALTLPLLSRSSQPVGLQLVGRKGDDELLCELAELLCSDLASIEKQLAQLKKQ